MDYILLGIGILIAMTISLIATHLWVGMWDGVIALLKKLFRVKKKNTVNWHTIDEKKQNRAKKETEKSNEEINESESLW